MLNRRQAPVAARSLRENMPPLIARGARHKKTVDALRESNYYIALDVFMHHRHEASIGDDMYCHIIQN